MKLIDPEIKTVLAGSSSPGMATYPAFDAEVLDEAWDYTDYLSLHYYMSNQKNDTPNYLAKPLTAGLQFRQIGGLFSYMKARKRSSHEMFISFDEYNTWHTVSGNERMEKPRWRIAPPLLEDTYTMEDAVALGSMLITILRNCDLVRMACFSPVVNTRGCIYSHRDGIVLRSTYFVFELFTRIMGDTVLDLWSPDIPERMDVTAKDGRKTTSAVLDLCAAKDGEAVTVSAVNKHPTETREITLKMPGVCGPVSLWTVNGPDADSYNDVGRTEVNLTCRDLGTTAGELTVRLDPHSVNVVKIG